MQMRQNNILTAIGLMSGTSMDGIDVALIRSDGESIVETVAHAEFPYEAAFKKQIGGSLDAAKTLTKSGDRNGELRDLETAITRRHASAVHEFLTANNLQQGDIDLIGFHGQTVLHRPDQGFTVQLGQGQLLADETGIAVVCDMRANDMAHGGQGAPLVPVYHQALAEGLSGEFANRKPLCFVNIGGISNVTFIGTDGELIAFDTGPGNGLIDQWVEAIAGIPFDQDGTIAAEGRVVGTIVRQYLENPFFARKIPKSLDRNDFSPPKPGAAMLEDGARTLANVSAAAIFKACDHLPQKPELWIICGGGRKNPHIVSDLQKLAQAANRAKVVLAEEAGFNGDTMEAEAWAYLAIRSKRHLPLTFPKTTGCNRPVSGGRLFQPVNRKAKP
jgi:anhydro-N-acetylmuramic acid kinase